MAKHRDGKPRSEVRARKGKGGYELYDPETVARWYSVPVDAFRRRVLIPWQMGRRPDPDTRFAEQVKTVLPASPTSVRQVAALVGVDDQNRVLTALHVLQGQGLAARALGNADLWMTVVPKPPRPRLDRKPRKPNGTCAYAVHANGGSQECGRPVWNPKGTSEADLFLCGQHRGQKPHWRVSQKRYDNDYARKLI